jgi:hypothetical protein
MKRSLSREQIHRIRRRHGGYRVLLLTISLILLLQPAAAIWPLLNSLASITLALVMMLFLTRYSPLQMQMHRRLLYGLGIAAIVMELVWMVCLQGHLVLGAHLAIPRLLIWTLFIGDFLLRKVRSLMLEPYVTLAVLMGAAAGYLLIGYLGAFLLHTLLLWHPASFDRALLPAGTDPLLEPMRTFPAMVLASFGSLTTVGNPITLPRHLLGSTGGLVITLTGQLYVAVLIALILGRFHRRGSS